MSYEGMRCFQCGELFRGRADAKYCSAKCRKAANRDKSVSVTTVTDKVSASVTDKCNDSEIKHIYPTCKCGECTASNFDCWCFLG